MQRDYNPHNSRSSSSSSSSPYLGRTAPKFLEEKYKFKITPQGIMDMLSKIESNDVKDFPSIKEFIKFLEKAFVGKLSPEVKQCFKSYENLLKNPNNNDIYGIIDEISCLTGNAPNVEGTTISRLMYKYYTKIYMQHTAMERLALADKPDSAYIKKDFLPDEYIQYIINKELSDKEKSDECFYAYQNTIKMLYGCRKIDDRKFLLTKLSCELIRLGISSKTSVKIMSYAEHNANMKLRESVYSSLYRTNSIVNEDNLKRVIAYEQSTPQHAVSISINDNLTEDKDFKFQSPAVQRFLRKKEFVLEQVKKSSRDSNHLVNTDVFLMYLRFLGVSRENTKTVLNLFKQDIIDISHCSTNKFISYFPKNKPKQSLIFEFLDATLRNLNKLITTYSTPKSPPIEKNKLIILLQYLPNIDNAAAKLLEMDARDSCRYTPHPFRIVGQVLYNLKKKIGESYSDDFIKKIEIILNNYIKNYKSKETLIIGNNPYTFAFIRDKFEEANLQYPSSLKSKLKDMYAIHGKWSLLEDFLSEWGVPDLYIYIIYNKYRDYCSAIRQHNLKWACRSYPWENLDKFNNVMQAINNNDFSKLYSILKEEKIGKRFMHMFSLYVTDEYIKNPRLEKFKEYDQVIIKPPAFDK